MKINRYIFWGILLISSFLAACSAEIEPNTTPVAVITTTPAEAATSLPTPTLKSTTLPTELPPTPTVTPIQTEAASDVISETVLITPTASPTMLPTATPKPTETPTPQGAVEFTIYVFSEITEKPIEGAEARLVSQSSDYDKVRISRSDGHTPFQSVPPETFLLSVEMDGFLPLTRTLSAEMLTEELTVYLTDSITVAITRINIHIRTGPGMEFGSLGLAIPGDVFRVIGVSADSEWLLIDTEYPVNSWVKLMPNTMSFNGDIDAVPIVNP